ncbi:hypothetical protein PACTADRAFT_31548 [Pachysolen tannophilus NRRL Y-2460]|uniref:Uncharacterized protein n=1 Tax=Pachysolen tannophilus NRRL Y-2460 TaxID=669874 RepID=A0A1E4U2C1_PACTA|nr:hypothetical protein PACTADRAFT_31548 [Pachysolen tannophilus NRRL Y-2460]
MKKNQTIPTNKVSPVRYQEQQLQYKQQQQDPLVILQKTPQYPHHSRPSSSTSSNQFSTISRKTSDLDHLQNSKIRSGSISGIMSTTNIKNVSLSPAKIYGLSGIGNNIGTNIGTNIVNNDNDEDLELDADENMINDQVDDTLGADLSDNIDILDRSPIKFNKSPIRFNNNNNNNNNNNGGSSTMGSTTGNYSRKSSPRRNLGAVNHVTRETTKTVYVPLANDDERKKPLRKGTPLASKIIPLDKDGEDSSKNDSAGADVNADADIDTEDVPDVHAVASSIVTDRLLMVSKIPTSSKLLEANSPKKIEITTPKRNNSSNKLHIHRHNDNIPTISKSDLTKLITSTAVKTIVPHNTIQNNSNLKLKAPKFPINNNNFNNYKNKRNRDEEDIINLSDRHLDKKRKTVLDVESEFDDTLDEEDNVDDKEENHHNSLIQTPIQERKTSKIENDGNNSNNNNNIVNISNINNRKNETINSNKSIDISSTLSKASVFINFKRKELEGQKNSYSSSEELTTNRKDLTSISHDDDENQLKEITGDKGLLYDLKTTGKILNFEDIGYSDNNNTLQEESDEVINNESCNDNKNIRDNYKKEVNDNRNIQAEYFKLEKWTIQKWNKLIKFIKIFQLTKNEKILNSKFIYKEFGCNYEELKLRILILNKFKHTKKMISGEVL